MKSISKNVLGVQELSIKDMKTIEGGFFQIALAVIAAAAGVIYLAGEMAYEKGRRDANCNCR